MFWKLVSLFESLKLDTFPFAISDASLCFQSIRFAPVLYWGHLFLAFHNWYMTFHYWYIAFHNGYMALKNWYTAFQNWYRPLITDKCFFFYYRYMVFYYWYMAFHNMYLTFYYWYLTFYYWYTAFHYWNVAFRNLTSDWNKNISFDMECLHKSYVKISSVCNEQLLREMRQNILLQTQINGQAVFWTRK